MIIAVGCDHAGIKLKEKVRGLLQEMGHGVIDFGTEGEGSVDYPDYAFKVANSVVSKESEGGVLICLTGNGMVMAANKVKGIRATLCLNNDMAYYSRRHNDSNILVLSQKYTDETELPDIVKTWTVTEFEGGRHIPRLQKIAEAEERQ